MSIFNPDSKVYKKNFNVPKFNHFGPKPKYITLRSHE